MRSRSRASPRAPYAASSPASRSWSTTMPEASRGARGALERLEAELAQLGSACVAFSGGADSSLVLAAATRVLGPARVVAFTAVSPTYLPEELQTARDRAAGLGVRHVVVELVRLDDHM